MSAAALRSLRSFVRIDRTIGRKLNVESWRVTENTEGHRVHGKHLDDRAAAAIVPVGSDSECGPLSLRAAGGSAPPLAPGRLRMQSGAEHRTPGPDGIRSTHGPRDRALECGAPRRFADSVANLQTHRAVAKTAKSSRAKAPDGRSRDLMRGGLRGCLKRSVGLFPCGASEPRPPGEKQARRVSGAPSASVTCTV